MNYSLTVHTINTATKEHQTVQRNFDKEDTQTMLSALAAAMKLGTLELVSLNITQEED